MRLALLVLALVALASPAAPAGIHALDVVGIPAIPEDGWVRHVQIIDSTWAAVPGQGAWAAEGWTQHASRLSDRDALGLAGALEAWAKGAPLPDPPTIWSLRREASQRVYTIDVVELPGAPARAQVILTAVAWLEEAPEFCPSCAPALVHTRQEMVLALAEVRALAAALEAWVGGDPDPMIWSKQVQQP